jgi:hypothetical protein
LSPPSSFEEGEAREDTDDDSFVLDEDEDVDGGGYWWWQSTEAKAARWVVPQWEVLAADRGGWRAGLKGLRVNVIRLRKGYVRTAHGFVVDNHTLGMR